MSLELIAFLILISSFLGMLTLIYRKIPILLELPEVIEKPLKESAWTKLKAKIKNFPILKSFSSEIFLQKLLSKIRILTLKTDNKTFSWLKKLRQKAKIRKNLNDNYWEELKKSTKNNDKNV